MEEITVLIRGINVCLFLVNVTCLLSAIITGCALQLYCTWGMKVDCGCACLFNWS